VPTTADPTPVAEPVAPPPPPGPPPRTFEEFVVTADSVLGLQVDSTVSSEVARVEDPVEARVTRDVRVGSEVAIPSGTRVIGSVVQVERGGKMKTKARIGIRFHTLVLSDGTRLRMSTEAVYREGQSPGQESAAKVGAAAVGGAILGAIIGGGKGAAIGGSVGAAGGTAAMMAGGRNPAVLNSGTAVTVRLREPVTVTVERNEYRD
jgi:type IV secretory pathway VirB10-like protein